jgi:type IV pilus assembly protein PilP
VSASTSATAPPVVYTESDFTVSDRNRDPFRGYLELFTASSSRAKTTIQQKIVAENYSLDELKLVAIVSGGTTPRAMLVDPNHKGHIVTRGELIGRTETIRSSGQGSSEYDVTWKVERIREGDVIFVREVPGSVTPVSTRVIALRPEGDNPIPRR